MLGTEPSISTDTDVSRGASTDISSVEMPQMTQCQFEFMAVLCMKEQIKVDVSDTAHIRFQEVIFYDISKQLTCFWNSWGSEPASRHECRLGPRPGTNASDIEVDTRCPLSDAMSFGASIS